MNQQPCLQTKSMHQSDSCSPVIFQKYFLIFIFYELYLRFPELLLWGKTFFNSSEECCIHCEVFSSLKIKNKRKNSSWNLCTCVFSWQCFILRSCHFSLKHWLKNSQPGVCTHDTNSPVSFSSCSVGGILLFPFVPLPWNVSLCSALLLLNLVLRWSRAEGSYQHEARHHCKTRKKLWDGQNLTSY